MQDVHDYRTERAEKRERGKERRAEECEQAKRGGTLEKARRRPLCTVYISAHFTVARARDWPERSVLIWYVGEFFKCDSISHASFKSAPEVYFTVAMHGATSGTQRFIWLLQLR